MVLHTHAAGGFREQEIRCHAASYDRCSTLQVHPAKPFTKAESLPRCHLSEWSQGAAAAVDRGGKDAYCRPAFFSTQAVISSISGPWASMIFRAIDFDSSSSPYFSSTSAMAIAPA